MKFVITSTTVFKSTSCVPNFVDFQNYKNNPPKNLTLLTFHHSLAKAILFKYFKEHFHTFWFSPCTEQKTSQILLMKMSVTVTLLEGKPFKLHG
jgi:hypothetical protein